MSQPNNDKEIDLEAHYGAKQFTASNNFDEYIEE